MDVRRTVLLMLFPITLRTSLNFTEEAFDFLSTKSPAIISCVYSVARSPIFALLPSISCRSHGISDELSLGLGLCMHANMRSFLRASA